MEFDLNSWIILAVRWVHIFASILWVGTTYYFTWLDGRFSELEKEAAKEGGVAIRGGASGHQVWMVHSGGFYKVDKTKAWDVAFPLHWFRYEALITWLSGMVLLGMVYWMGGIMVDQSVADITNARAVWTGVAVVFLGWGIYDGVMNSPIGRNGTLAAAVGFAMIAGLSWWLSTQLSGRAVYIHIGALFGTIMVNNVWMRILPAQKKMVAAVKEGRDPDPALAARAKLRSKQNTFLAVPVVFLMTSNHFPTITYGTSQGWMILCAMVLVGWAMAAWIRRA